MEFEEASKLEGAEGMITHLGIPSFSPAKKLGFDKNRFNIFENSKTGHGGSDVICTASKGNVRHSFVGEVAGFLEFLEFSEKWVGSDSKHHTRRGAALYNTS